MWLAAARELEPSKLHLLHVLGRYHFVSGQLLPSPDVVTSKFRNGAVAGDDAPTVEFLDEVGLWLALARSLEPDPFD